jgi:hypothetical protein
MVNITCEIRDNYPNWIIEYEGLTVIVSLPEICDLLRIYGEMETIIGSLSGSVAVRLNKSEDIAITMQLTENLLKMFPEVFHKFNSDDNKFIKSVANILNVDWQTGLPKG